MMTFLLCHVTFRMPYLQWLSPLSGLWGRALLIFFLTMTGFPAKASVNTYPILVYHRFGASVMDSMTVRTTVFNAQIARLRQEGYHFVSLSTLIDGIEGKTSLPDKTVAITVDDGHQSVYTELLPIIRREQLPVTLFIYPSAISNASYAMTWEQLSEIKNTGLAEVQSHTFWHPNFHTEHARLTPEKYNDFVRMQLEKPRSILKKKLDVDAQLLAWPFGIHDSELEKAAKTAGYKAAFALDNRSATSSDAMMALPRYLIIDSYSPEGLIRLLRNGERRTQGVRP